LRNVVEDDGLLLGVEITVYRDRIGAEADACQRRAVRSQQRGSRAARIEARVDVQLDGLHAALDQSVDVEEARGNRDLALRKDARLVGVDRCLEAVGKGVRYGLVCQAERG